MTNPNPNQSQAPAPIEDPFDTKLITRLANEFYSEFMNVSAPISTTQSVDGRSAAKDNGLAGVYPAKTEAYAPPVHPAAEEFSDAKSVDSGEYSPGAVDSYQFGEPRLEEEGTHEVSRHSETFKTKAEKQDAQSLYFLNQKDVDPVVSSTQWPLKPPVAKTNFDVQSVRRDFPALHQQVNGKPLIWLDNAATTHKPLCVIEATSRFYSRYNSNIHRGAHTLAAEATDLYEGAREKVRQFLGAALSEEIIFVRGTTEAINLVAQSYGRENIGAGDEIIISTMEHHANIVPWQILAKQTGAVIRVAPINDKGELLLEQFAKLFSSRTKFVSITQVANALGTVNPVEEIIALSRAHGVPVLVDGAQSTPHMPVNVQAMDADFFTFSGHKIFGPTGIGALYGKKVLLESMPPWQGGGNMIKDVTFTKTTFEGLPNKFEAGTPNIAGVVGLGAAVEYLMRTGLAGIAAYEHDLLVYATAALESIPGLRLIGTAANKASVLSFVKEGYLTQEIGKYLDQHGIAVRAGHHCAQPSLRRFGLDATVRPSLAFYNTRQEIDALVLALKKLPRKTK